MVAAACTAIDSMEWTGVVGTISGDDTIFVLCKTGGLCENIYNEYGEDFKC